MPAADPGTLLILRGLPASGKTTYARALVDAAAAGTMARLNRDDIRAMTLPAGYRQPQAVAEALVSTMQHDPIPHLLRAGVDVVIDDTNLRARHVRNLAQLAAQAGAPWECVDRFLQVDVDECVRRDAARDRPVGEDVIRGMHARFLNGRTELPAPVLDVAVAGKPYVPVLGTPCAVMVDIDGTVALHGDRDPYDTSRYHEDTPNRAVIDTVCMAWEAGHRVVFCSGRSAEFREATEAWLHEHVLPQGAGWELHMRPTGDIRNDAVVKLELFDEHIRDRFDVRFVLDDRDRVVAAFRSIGLTVMQVAPGNF